MDKIALLPENKLSFYHIILAFAEFKEVIYSYYEAFEKFRGKLMEMESRTNQSQNHSCVGVLFDSCSKNSQNSLEKSRNGDFFCEMVGRAIIVDTFLYP